MRIIFVLKFASFSLFSRRYCAVELCILTVVIVFDVVCSMLLLRTCVRILLFLWLFIINNQRQMTTSIKLSQKMQQVVIHCLWKPPMNVMYSS